MLFLAGRALKMFLIIITDTIFCVHSTGHYVTALYCDAATLWLEKSKHY